MPLGFGSQLDVTPPPQTPGQPPMPKDGLGGLVSGAPAPPAGGPPGGNTAPYGTGSGGPDVAANQASAGASSLPQPMIQGIMEAGVQMGLMLDSFAQATPDLNGEVDQVRSALQVYLGRLMTAGAGPTGPTAPGQPFPGGGFDRGPLR